MMYVRFPLSLRNVEDLLFERGIDLCHERVRMLIHSGRRTFITRSPRLITQTGGSRATFKNSLVTATCRRRIATLRATATPKED
jgi:hypothetical protein